MRHGQQSATGESDYRSRVLPIEKTQDNVDHGQTCAEDEDGRFNRHVCQCFGGPGIVDDPFDWLYPF
jgi:hypothetical protein